MNRRDAIDAERQSPNQRGWRMEDRAWNEEFAQAAQTSWHSSAIDAERQSPSRRRQKVTTEYAEYAEMGLVQRLLSVYSAYSVVPIQLTTSPLHV